MATPVHERRKYDNTLRQQRAAQTRERIVAAGSDILHGSRVHDWSALTIRSAAERAGVSERTAYRYFENERALRDAVIQRLQEESGIDLDGLALGAVGDVAARIFRHVSTFPRTRRASTEPTLTEASRRQHEALLRAVEAKAAAWPETDRVVAAAALDVLWSVASFERLVVDWGFEREDAIRAITWVVELVENAILANHRPGEGTEP